MHVVACLVSSPLPGFWSSPEGTALLARSREALSLLALGDAGGGSGELFALADAKELARALRRAGFARVRRCAPAKDGSPLGWLACAGELAAEAGLAGPVLLANLENPLLGGDILATQAQAFAEGAQDILVSAAPAHDHPCQLFTPYRLLETGVLHMFGPETPCPGRRATRPFAFDWSRRALAGDGGGRFFVRRHSPLGLVFKPLEGPPEAEAEIFERLGPGVASISLPEHLCHEPGWAGWTLAGRSFRVPGQAPQLALWQRPEQGECLLRLAADPAWTGQLYLRLTLLAGGAALGPHLDFDLGPSLGPLTLRLDLQGAELAAYSVLCVCEDQGCDFIEVLEPVDGLWSYDPLSTRVYNCATGKEITGRQGFPAVVSPDGSFVLASAELLGQVEERARLGQVAVAEIDGPAALKIRTELDVLRWRLFATPGQEARP